MPSSIFGAPTHALLIHLVVVLLPLSALGGLVMCFAPPVARRFGGLIAVAAIVCVPATALAASVGEDLEHQLRAQTLSATEQRLLEEHTRLGDSLLPWVIVLAVGATALVLADTVVRHRALQLVSAPSGAPHADVSTTAPTGRLLQLTRSLDDKVLRLTRWAAIAVTVVGAVLSVYFVIRIGHLGAEAAWSRVSSAAS